MVLIKELFKILLPVNKDVEMVQDIGTNVMIKITSMVMAVVVNVKLKKDGFVQEEHQWVEVHVFAKYLKIQLLL